MISPNRRIPVAAGILVCFVLANFAASTVADDKKNKSSGMSGSKKSSSSSGKHQGTTSSSGGSMKPANPLGHTHSTPPSSSGHIPPSSTPGVIIRSGPGYVPGSTNVVPAPSGPTVIQPNLTPTAPVANTIPSQPVSVAPNEIPQAATPANEVPGGFDPVEAEQLAAICDRARGQTAELAKQLNSDPIGQDADVYAAGSKALEALGGATSLTPETDATVSKGFEEIRRVADAKVAAGTFTAAQRDEFNSKLNALELNVRLILQSCSGPNPPAPGDGIPPAAPGNGTPPLGGNPPAPAPMPLDPAAPVTIFINIYDPIIIIEDPLIDDGVILAIDPSIVVIGTGGEGELTITSGAPADLGIPVMDSEPISEADAGLTGACGVILSNPKASRGRVNYTLDGKPFSMEPGYTHELPGGRTYLVEFDKGGAFGKARYSLTEGAYDFGIANQGWDIFSKTYEATLDNTGNSNDFHYVRNDQRLVVKARAQETLAGKCPILIIFDQGNGGEPARRVLREGSYKVGVDTSTKLLDLFRNDAPARVHASPRPATTTVPAPVPAKP